MRTRLLSPVFLALVVSASAASAQRPTPVPDSLLQLIRGQASPLALPDNAILQPGSWRYRVLMVRGENAIELARRTVTVEVAPGDTTSWLLLEETDSHGRVMADSLIVGRGDLRPSRRVAQLGPVRLSLSFGSDSIRGAMTVPGGDSLPVSLPMVPGLVGSGAMLESALAALSPLDSGWTAAAVELAPGPAGVALVPVTLEVERAESLAVPAGQFTAWRVRASGGASEQWLWLDRASGRLLRLEMTPPQSADVTYLTVLEEVIPGG